MTCQQCNTAGSILRRTFNAQGSGVWCCPSCFVPREPKTAAVRVVDLSQIPCDFYPAQPAPRKEPRYFAISATQGDVAGAGGCRGVSAQNGAETGGERE